MKHSAPADRSPKAVISRLTDSSNPRKRRERRRPPFACIRIGEATNPGPVAVRLNDLISMVNSVKSNPCPQKCRQSTARPKGDASKAAGQYALSVTTASTTCWSCAKPYVLKTKAEVLLIQ